MARVQVADDVWADFRAAVGNRPISDALGELVTREVDRYRSRRIKDGQLDPRELTDALQQAARQQADLAAIVERLERLHRAGGPASGGDALSELLERAPLDDEPVGGEEERAVQVAREEIERGETVSFEQARRELR